MTSELYWGQSTGSSEIKDDRYYQRRLDERYRVAERYSGSVQIKYDRVVAEDDECLKSPTPYGKGGYMRSEDMRCAYGAIPELPTQIIQDLIAERTKTVEKDFDGKIAKLVYIDPGDEDIFGFSKARSCATYIHLAEKEQAEAEGRDKMRMVFIFQDKESWPSFASKEGKKDESLKVSPSKFVGLPFANKVIEVYRWPGEMDYTGGKTIHGYSYYDCISYSLYLDPSNAWTDFVIRSMDDWQLQFILRGKLLKDLLVGPIGHRDRDETINRCWLLKDKIYEDLDAFTRGGDKCKIFRQVNDFSDTEYEEYETDYDMEDSSDTVAPILHSGVATQVDECFDTKGKECETDYGSDDSLESVKSIFPSGGATRGTKRGNLASAMMEYARVKKLEMMLTLKNK